MAEYLYPAIFSENEDSSYTVTFPDLPGCITEGKSLANAMVMAQSALLQWVEYLNDKKMVMPKASDPRQMKCSPENLVNLVRVEIKDNRAVRRTVSIPKWMDDRVTESGLSLSKVLQDALSDRLNAD